MTLQVSPNHQVSDLGHTNDHNAIVAEILRMDAVLGTVGAPSGIATLDANGILTSTQRPVIPTPPSPFDSTHLPVLVFTSAAARNTSLTAPVGGQIVWLQNEKRFEQRMNGAWEPYGVFVDDAPHILAGSWTAGKPVYFFGGYGEYATNNSQFLDINVPASTPNGPTSCVVGTIVMPSAHNGTPTNWNAVINYGISSLSNISVSCYLGSSGNKIAANTILSFFHFTWLQ